MYAIEDKREMSLTPPRPPKKKKGTGRRKITIERIERTDYRRAAFAKRRKSLFNKAKELSVLCGAETAVITFSQAGKPFTCGYPSVNAVVDRFQKHSGHQEEPSEEKKKPAGWWDAPIEGMGLDQLEETKKALEELRDQVRKKLDGKWLYL